MKQLTDTILNTPVEGVNLRSGTLHDQLNNHQPTLLVFLRHFG